MLMPTTTHMTSKYHYSSTAVNKLRL